MEQNTERFYGWRLVWASLVICMIMPPIAVALANLFQGPVTEDLGISPAQFALSNALVQGVGIFLAPVVSSQLAKSANNFNRLTVIGVILYALAVAGYGLAPNIYFHYACSLLLGLAFQMGGMVPISIMLNNWFIDKRGTAVSTAMMGLGVGGTIFSPILTYLINAIGWRFTYLLYAGLILIICLPIQAKVFKFHPEEMGMLPYRDNQGLKTDPEADVEVVQAKLHSHVNPRQGFFMSLIIGTMILGLVNNAGLGQFPPYMTSLHGLGFASMIVSIYSLVGLIGKFTMGKANDRYGVRFSIIYATILMIATFLLMTQGQSQALAIVAALCFGMGNCIASIIPPLITAEIYDQASFGSAYGYVQSAMNLGMALGSVSVATAASVVGYQPAWLLMAGLCVVYAFFWLSAMKQSDRAYTV